LPENVRLPIVIVKSSSACASRVAEFINGHVREMIWGKMLEGFELAHAPSAELAEKEPR
jgi:hypothetical protein